MTEPASPAVTRIILVRHGESVTNAGGKAADHISNPLTELGRAQARDFAERLDCKPTLIVISPFLRAQQTAEPLRQRFPDVPVEEWPVEEFSYLNPLLHQGTSEADREPDVVAYWQRQDPAYIEGPGAESFTLFLDRAREAIRRLLSRDSGGRIVIFTHGFFMQAFRLVLLFPNATDAELMANFRRFHFVNLIQNIDSLEFEVRDGKIKLVGPQHQTGFTLQGAKSHV
ncbi:MAG TPA: histidine phosphatase family protein [Edaphobacter sp.]|jgi:broad specificity phosphatase PhoE|nr:histidine phosphatase family protein [Edaphobacter sp.]